MRFPEPRRFPGFCEFRIEETEQSIPSRFEEQVKRHGSRLAVKTRHHELTYEALNRLANRIARAVLARRRAAEEPVALLLEQGAPLVAAILGVLKAGKIYVPLDPSYPRPAISAMLEVCGAELLVTDAANRPLADSWKRPGGAVLDLDEIEEGTDAENPSLRLSPGARSYIFYTSGSTGRPKGVVDTHRNVLHNVLRYTNSLFLCPEDRLTLLQSCSFSGSVSSLFGALLNGACVFPFNLREEGPGALAPWLREEGITVYHSVPAIFRSLGDAGVDFPRLRVIRLEGDQASWRDVELYKKCFPPDCVLVNGLGATETGLSRQYFIGRETEVGEGVLPVGYPVRDMDILLLDGEGCEIRDGGVGEIAVRSRYLAEGYWGRPELTREALLAGADGGSVRTYRTGDMGRLRLDGCLEYLGRKDFQAKIRGHRVEPAEVEAALLGIESIRQAAVVTRAEGTRDPRLVAFVVPASVPAPEPNRLRVALAETLPDYTVPSAFVFLKSLPVDSNGKVDRRALLEVRIGCSTPYVPPRDALERQLVKIGEEVLGVEPIGVRDDFFELGVDSLSAGRMANRIRTALGGRVSVASLFEAPSIEQLARLLRRGAAAHARAQRTGARISTSSGPPPTSK